MSNYLNELTNDELTAMVKSGDLCLRWGDINEEISDRLVAAGLIASGTYRYLAVDSDEYRNHRADVAAALAEV